jgi:hypothetical protein
MTENVEVAVVGANFEEGMLGSVPLIDYFLDKIFAMIQSKAEWPLVALAARVALDMHLHLTRSPDGFFSHVLQDLQ